MCPYTPGAVLYCSSASPASKTHTHTRRQSRKLYIPALSAGEEMLLLCGQNHPALGSAFLQGFHKERQSLALACVPVPNSALCSRPQYWLEGVGWWRLAPVTLHSSGRKCTSPCVPSAHLPSHPVSTCPYKNLGWKGAVTFFFLFFQLFKFGCEQETMLNSLTITHNPQTNKGAVSELPPQLSRLGQSCSLAFHTHSFSCSCPLG